MTYEAKVYRTQGAAELVITSSGSLNVDGTANLSGTLGTSGSANINLETGGTLTVKSGSHVAIASGSSMTIAIPLEFASGGYVKMPLTNKTKTNKGTAIVAGTVNTITCSSTGSECNLPAPVSGAPIYAVCIARTNPGTYTLSSTVDFTGLTVNKLKFDATGENALLIGTTAAWSLVYGTATSTS